MKFSAALVALTASTCHAFSPSAVRTSRTMATPTAVKIVPGDSADVLARINAILEEAAAPSVDPDFDQIVQSYFPGAIDNNHLTNTVVEILRTKGFSAENTLVATSLCCDELARRLEDDFVKIYGNNFALGGLAGFPFAGNTGFGAMAAHIPDDGYCLVIYGPHVGISKDGTVGKVERQGIALVDTCCGSAVAADRYLKGITDGGATMVADVQKFTDFQQGAVQQLILPHGKRLSDAENRMVELPLALFDSQDVLMQDIVQAGAGGTKAGLAMLGGIQINTNPGVPDYFLPIRFDFMNNKGEILESLLPTLTSAPATNTNRISRKVKRPKTKPWTRDRPITEYLASTEGTSSQVDTTTKASLGRKNKRKKNFRTPGAARGFAPRRNVAKKSPTVAKQEKDEEASPPPQDDDSPALSVPLLRQRVVGFRQPNTPVSPTPPTMTPQIAPAEPVPVRRARPPLPPPPSRPATTPTTSTTATSLPVPSEIQRLLDNLPPDEASKVQKLVESLPEDVQEAVESSIAAASTNVQEREGSSLMDTELPLQPELSNMEQPSSPTTPPRKKLADEIRRKLALEGDPQGVLSSGIWDRRGAASSSNMPPTSPPSPPMRDQLRSTVHFDPTEPSVQRRQHSQRREPTIVPPDSGIGWEIPPQAFSPGNTRQPGIPGSVNPSNGNHNMFEPPASRVWDADSLFPHDDVIMRQNQWPPRKSRTKPSAPLSPDIVPGADRSRRNPSQPEPRSSLRPDDNLSSAGRFFVENNPEQLPPRKGSPKDQFVPPDARINGEDNYIEVLQDYIEALQDYIDTTYDEPSQGRVVPPYDPASTWESKPSDKRKLDSRYPPRPPPSFDAYGARASQYTNRGPKGIAPTPSQRSSPLQSPTLQELEEDFFAMSADFLSSEEFGASVQWDKNGAADSTGMRNANPDMDENAMGPVVPDARKKSRAASPPIKNAPVKEEDLTDNPIAMAVAGGRIF